MIALAVLCWVGGGCAMFAAITVPGFLIGDESEHPFEVDPTALLFCVVFWPALLLIWTANVLAGRR
jgi:hypothetical protein